MKIKAAPGQMFQVVKAGQITGNLITFNGSNSTQTPANQLVGSGTGILPFATANSNDFATYGSVLSATPARADRRSYCSEFRSSTATLRPST